jgi:hypothetical protein
VRPIPGLNAVALARPEYIKPETTGYYRLNGARSSPKIIGDDSKSFLVVRHELRGIVDELASADSVARGSERTPVISHEAQPLAQSSWMESVACWQIVCGRFLRRRVEIGCVAKERTPKRER